MKRFAVNALRFSVSAGLLIYLISLADPDKILTAMSQADSAWLTVAIGLFLLAILLFATRWMVLLHAVDIRIPWSRLLVYYLIGYFFNNFLPTTIGGDVSRAYNVARDSQNRPASIAAVLLERILGLIATLTLGAVALPQALRYFSGDARLLLGSVMLSLLLLVSLALLTLLSKRVSRQIHQLLQHVTLWDIGGRLVALLNSLQAYRLTPRAVLLGFLLSLFCQILLVLMNYALVKALHLQGVHPGYLFLVVPVTFVIGLLPSINGLGVRDFGYARLLGRVGLSSAQSLSLSFMNTLIPLIASVLGGICLLFLRRSGQHTVGDER